MEYLVQMEISADYSCVGVLERAADPGSAVMESENSI